MIRRSVRIQLAVFVILAVAGTAYTGARYVGFTTPFQAKPYTVTAVFKDSGGIFSGAEVTNRGVTIGRVGTLHLVPEGVAADLVIQPKNDRIPADVKAVVGNLSAVGEQYVDLQPQTDGAPYLHDGSTIGVDRTQTPLDNATLLLNLDKLVKSVDADNLAVVIDELGKAFDGLGPDLRRLIQSGDELTRAAQASLPETIRLINDGKTVLDTQQATSAQIKTFAAQLAGLADQLVQSDADIRRLMDGGAEGARQMQDLLAKNRSTLPAFLGNLTTLGQIQSARLPGLESVLVLYPMNVANGFLGAEGGYAHFGLVLTSDPKVCTSGYEKTKRRANNPQDWGGKANLDITCTAPDQGGPSNPSGAVVRGSNNAPRPAGDDTRTNYTGRGEGYDHDVSKPRGTQAASSGSPKAAGPSPTVAPYDPLSGLLLAPDGQAYLLGETGGQQQLLGDRSWEWLLLAPASR